MGRFFSDLYKQANPCLEYCILLTSKSDIPRNLIIALYRVCIIEPWNCIGWKWPVRSSSPTINSALPRPPQDHISKCHIYTSFRYLQGWKLHHFLASLFQCLRTLSVKRSPLIPNLNLLWCKLGLFPFALYMQTLKKKIIKSVLKKFSKWNTFL